MAEPDRPDVDHDDVAAERAARVALMAAAKRIADRIPQVKLSKGLGPPIIPKEERASRPCR